MGSSKGSFSATSATSQNHSALRWPQSWASLKVVDFDCNLLEKRKSAFQEKFLSLKI
jgi:hypothetical protein